MDLKLVPDDSCVHKKRCAPLLKWPGGKRSLLPHIRSLIPSQFNRYYEPFLGGGAVFFDLCPQTAVLSDKNAELIECYCEIRDCPSAVIAILSAMKNTREDYYSIRSSRPSTRAGRAARLIYLTTLAFNGIYRVNLRGEFNVPYGHKTHLVPCDPGRITSASAALCGARLAPDDFEAAVADARSGDLVYLDPPYTAAHSKNGFLKYNEVIFSWEDQIRLAEVARNLAARGCYVIVSNANFDDIKQIYTGFSVREVARPSVIAASSEFRGLVSECLFHNVPNTALVDQQSEGKAIRIAVSLGGGRWSSPQ